MLEEWCWDASVLGGFARHAETGAAIPAELVQRMRAADEFGKGLRVRQQMYYAATSLAFQSFQAAGPVASPSAIASACSNSSRTRLPTAVAT